MGFLNEILISFKSKNDIDKGYHYNQLAMNFEKNGNIVDAIKYYEKSIECNFYGNHPYDRLVILYRKQNKTNDVIRVLKKAIEDFTILNSTTKRSDVPIKLQRFKEQLGKELRK